MILSFCQFLNLSYFPQYGHPMSSGVIFNNMGIPWAVEFFSTTWASNEQWSSFPWHGHPMSSGVLFHNMGISGVLFHNMDIQWALELPTTHIIYAMRIYYHKMRIKYAFRVYFHNISRIQLIDLYIKCFYWIIYWVLSEWLIDTFNIHDWIIVWFRRLTQSFNLN